MAENRVPCFTCFRSDHFRGLKLHVFERRSTGQVGGCIYIHTNICACQCNANTHTDIHTDIHYLLFTHVWRQSIRFIASKCSTWVAFFHCAFPFHAAFAWFKSLDELSRDATNCHVLHVYPVPLATQSIGSRSNCTPKRWNDSDAARLFGFPPKSDRIFFEALIRCISKVQHQLIATGITNFALPFQGNAPDMFFFVVRLFVTWEGRQVFCVVQTK